MLRQKGQRRPIPPKAITINEIAREAGVSTATVSRVFNQPAKVKKQTRERVSAVIDRHHYVSHGLAGGLASRRSRFLRLVIPTVTNSIYASSTQAVHHAAQRAGYTVLVGVSDFSEEREAALIHQLVSRRVEGLILTGSSVRPLCTRRLSAIIVPSSSPGSLPTRESTPASHSITSRRPALQWITSSGWDIDDGLICGRTDLNDRALQRKTAFEQALRDFGIELDPELIFERSFEFVEGRAAMHRMLQLGQPPTEYSAPMTFRPSARFRNAEMRDTLFPLICRSWVSTTCRLRNILLHD